MSELYFDKKSGEYKPKQPGVIYYDKECERLLEERDEALKKATERAKEGTKRLKKMNENNAELLALLYTVE